MFNGERLKKLREEKSLTQIELGKVFNISHSTINRYENGLRQPDNETLISMAGFFNVSVDYLLGITNNRNAADHITDALTDDPELYGFWQEMKDREELQLLFKQVRTLTKLDIKQLIRMIKAIEDEEDKE